MIHVDGFVSVVLLAAWLSGFSTDMIDDVYLFAEIKVSSLKREFFSKWSQLLYFITCKLFNYWL